VYVPGREWVVLYSGVTVTPRAAGAPCRQSAFWNGAIWPLPIPIPLAAPEVCVSVSNDTWVLDLVALTWRRVAGRDSGDAPFLFAPNITSMRPADADVYNLGVQLVYDPVGDVVYSVLGVTPFTYSGGSWLTYAFSLTALRWSVVPTTAPPCNAYDVQCGAPFAATVSWYNPARHSIVAFAGSDWSEARTGGDCHELSLRTLTWTLPPSCSIYNGPFLRAKYAIVPVPQLQASLLVSGTGTNNAVVSGTHVFARGVPHHPSH
jgi:hypothetical protein